MSHGSGSAAGELLLPGVLDSFRPATVICCTDHAGRGVTVVAPTAGDDPDRAHILAYDGARFGCTALLIHQGLRPTTAGGHYASASRISPAIIRGLLEGELTMFRSGSARLARAMMWLVVATGRLSGEPDLDGLAGPALLRLG